jgi:leader peptidase (prepilin peptidase)/N-methyltransferase
LIPVFSWLGSKGRCRHCGKKISTRYPLVEITALAASIAVFWFKGISVEAFILVSFVPFLIALAVIDFEKMILPDQLTAICGALAFLLAGWLSWQSGEVLLFASHLAAAVVYGLVSWALGFITGRLLGKESLGFGDVKFFAIAGMGLGLEVLPVFMILAGGLGILQAVVWQVLTKSRVFPFGPALIMAFFLLLLQ